MNKKRWIAVGIACGLGVVSVATSTVTDKFVPTKNESAAQLAKLATSNGLDEETIKAGSSKDKIVQLNVTGTISATSDSGSLFSSGSSYDHALLLNSIEAIKKDSHVKAILLVVDSPGGGTYESAQLATGLQQLQKKYKIPMYVSMQSTAASGGYYVSASADKIYAADETMTGSIGVIMSSINYSGLMEKYGVQDTTVKSGEHKDMGSATKPVSESDQAILQSMVDSSYSRFVKVVSNGRKISVPEVKKLADGRVYDGSQALKVGLVDKIGYKAQALKDLRKAYHLENASVVTYSNESTGFNLSSLISGLKSSTSIPTKLSGSDVSTLMDTFGSEGAPKMMYLYGGEKND